MASVFKNSIKPNVSTTFVEIYKAPVGKASYLIQCDVACVGDTGVQTSVRIKKADGTIAHLVRFAPVPVGSTIQVIDGQKIVLEAEDAFEVKCDTAGEVVDVIVSLIENVND